MHVDHIQKNKKNLEIRFEIIRQIREFFWAQDFVEVETPHIVPSPGQDPYIQPMRVDFKEDKKRKHTGYLHTSPEYSMKKMLAGGFGNIFSLGKVYRDVEPFDSQHNPEFTMLEWYRVDADMFDIMDDVEKLLQRLASSFNLPVANIQRMHMRDVWKKYTGFDLDTMLTTKAMYGACTKLGHAPKQDEAYENLFYTIFVTHIEPELSKLDGMTIVHHYPAQMAALSRLSQHDPRYAERFEVYGGGFELANAFSELTDAGEQLSRLQKEQKERREAGVETYDIDMEFIEAVERMPKSAGIALGVDRLVMYLLGCKDVDDVLVLPASTLFET